MQLQAIANRRQRGIDRVRIGCAIDDPNINYAMMAKSLGVHGEGPIENPRDLGPALKRAIAVVNAASRRWWMWFRRVGEGSAHAVVFVPIDSGHVRVATARSPPTNPRRTRGKQLYTQPGAISATARAAKAAAALGRASRRGRFP